MKRVWIVMYSGKPLFAFTTKEEAELYIETACKNAMGDGWPMKLYSRENFYATPVFYL